MELIKVLKQTLHMGTTSLTFTDDSINNESIIEVYTNVYGISTNTQTQLNNTITLTFDAQTSDIDVCVVVNNISSKFEVVDNLQSHSFSDALTANQGRVLKEELDVLSNIVDTVADDVEMNTAAINMLGESKQNKLTAGENITIENDVISATGGSGSTTDYEELDNKPSINNITLIGDRSLQYLGIASQAELAGINQTINTMQTDIDIKLPSSIVSDAWVQKIYQAGKYAIDNNRLWKCLVPNSDKPSEGANWHETTIEEELAKIEEKLEDCVTLATVTTNNADVSIPNLSDFRFLLIMVPSVANTYILAQSLFPISTMIRTIGVHVWWYAQFWDGSTNLYGRVQLKSSTVMNVQFSNASGVYIIGIK